MYQSPRVERFGTFRELTLQGGDDGKRVMGFDLAFASGDDPDTDQCNGNAEPGSAAGCQPSQTGSLL
jgi:hypothetical protein